MARSFIKPDIARAVQAFLRMEPYAEEDYQVDTAPDRKSVELTYTHFQKHNGKATRAPVAKLCVEECVLKVELFSKPPSHLTRFTNIAAGVTLYSLASVRLQDVLGEPHIRDDGVRIFAVNRIGRDCTFTLFLGDVLRVSDGVVIVTSLVPRLGRLNGQPPARFDFDPQNWPLLINVGEK